MIEALKLFDPYNRQARLYPALLALLPAAITALAWFPQLLTGSVGGALVTIVAMCGGLYLLAEVARTAGKKLEPTLLRDWGGWPSTRLLRHGDTDLPTVTKERYQAVLSRKVGVSWPSAADERADPGRCDEIYRSATDWLREQTRGPQYGRLLVENTSYGFRRNLRGVRAVAIILCVGSLLLPIGYLLVSNGWLVDQAWADLTRERRPARLVAVAVALAALGFWIFVVRASWVKRAGDEYARALLACCDTLL